MAFFKILLIILVSLPVVVFIIFQYVQLLRYIRARNQTDKMREEALRAAVEAELQEQSRKEQGRRRHRR